MHPLSLIRGAHNVGADVDADTDVDGDVDADADDPLPFD